MGKNTYFVCNLAQYLIDNNEGKFPEKEEFYIGLYEMGPKSVSLCMRAAFKEKVWLSVDLHVYESIRALGWTNAKSAEETSYQVLKLGYVAVKFLTTLNNEIPLHKNARSSDQYLGDLRSLPDWKNRNFVEFTFFFHDRQVKASFFFKQQVFWRVLARFFQTAS